MISLNNFQLFVVLAVAASTLGAPEPKAAPGVATVYSAPVGLGYAAPLGYSAYSAPLVRSYGYGSYAAAPIAYSGLGYAAPGLVYG